MEKVGLLKRLNYLEKKIHKLIIKCSTLQKEHDKVVEENIALREKILQQEEELQNFQYQEKFTNIVSSVANGTDSKKGLKKKLNEYIDEVDKCIVHLNR